jgi:hypothetical protein
VRAKRETMHAGSRLIVMWGWLGGAGRCRHSPVGPLVTAVYSCGNACLYEAKVMDHADCFSWPEWSHLLT